MSEADKLFEELGYSKEIYPADNELHPYESINYSNQMFFIEFNGYNKSIFIGAEFAGENMLDKRLTMQELKAINKKCEELGWE